VFLGSQHARNERRTWVVVALTAIMMVGSWAYGLNPLLRHCAARRQRGHIRDRLETKGDRVTDLHVWLVGPGHRAHALDGILCKRPGDAEHLRWPGSCVWLSSRRPGGTLVLRRETQDLAPLLDLATAVDDEGHFLAVFHRLDGRTFGGRFDFSNL
jgi:hypothetical protein